jgi:hypothetical protein
VSCALVGDVAYVVRIETLRSTPLIVDRSTKTKLAFDRSFSLLPRLIESSPAKLLPETAHLCRLLLDAINRFGDQLNCAARGPWRNRTHAALRRLPLLGLVPRKVGGKEAVDLSVWHQAGQSSEAAL